MRVSELWIPIVATGIANHILSTIAWVALPHHKPEWKKCPVEDKLQDFIVDEKIPPGQYIFPHASDGNVAKSEEMKVKVAKNSGLLVVWPQKTNMGKAIAQTLTFS